jgi:hypothetical protein
MWDLIWPTKWRNPKPRRGETAVSRGREPGVRWEIDPSPFRGGTLFVSPAEAGSGFIKPAYPGFRLRGSLP